MGPPGLHLATTPGGRAAKTCFMHSIYSTSIRSHCVDRAAPSLNAAQSSLRLGGVRVTQEDSGRKALTFVQLVLLLQAVRVQENAAVAVQFFALAGCRQFVGTSFCQQLLLLAGGVARRRGEKVVRI